MASDPDESTDFAAKRRSHSPIHHSPISNPLESAPAFIAHGELARLVKYLRILGFNCSYDGGWSLPYAITAAIDQSRVLLTAKPVSSTARLAVHRVVEDELIAQLSGVMYRFSLGGSIRFLSRCLECNSPLHPVESDLFPAKIPASVRSRQLPISHCDHCGKNYWHGSHVERMKKRLAGMGFSINSAC